MGSDFHRGSVLVYSSQPGGKNLVPSNQKSFTSVLLVKDEWNPEIGENIFFDCLTMICYEDLSHFDFSGRQKKMFIFGREMMHNWPEARLRIWRANVVR